MLQTRWYEVIAAPVKWFAEHTLYSSLITFYTSTHMGGYYDLNNLSHFFLNNDFPIQQGIHVGNGPTHAN